MGDSRRPEMPVTWEPCVRGPLLHGPWGQGERKRRRRVIMQSWELLRVNLLPRFQVPSETIATDLTSCSALGWRQRPKKCSSWAEE